MCSESIILATSGSGAPRSALYKISCIVIICATCYRADFPDSGKGVRNCVKKVSEEIFGQSWNHLGKSVKKVSAWKKIVQKVSGEILGESWKNPGNSVKKVSARKKDFRKSAREGVGKNVWNGVRKTVRKVTKTVIM